MIARALLGGFLCLAASRASAAQPTLATTIPSIVTAQAAAYVGAPSPGLVLHLVVSLPQRNTQALDAVIASITNPASPNYRHYLSVGDFTERFGPTAGDYTAAAAFFAAQGLTIAALTPNRMLIDIDAKVSDIERVFHVALGLYRHPTENRLFLSPDRPPTLDLAIPVQEVIGLDDFVRPKPKLVHSSVSGTRNAGGTGPGGQFTGRNMRTIYYPGGQLIGKGQSVGLMELAGYNIADVNSFFKKGYGLDFNVSIVGIKTDSLSLNCTVAEGCDDSEQALDIEYTISMAPGLSSVRVYVGSSPEDVLNRMATDNISKVLSTSWGWNETFATDDAIFKEFAAQGQTNLTASGDDSSLSASGPRPEEDANIVAVGGTDVATATAGGNWASETGWNGSAGGPSLDKKILIEPYQLPIVTTVKGASKTLRNVPDIAANANTNMEICADGTCTGGYGGTSFASPIWAGVISLANEQAASAGKPVVGFINPALYALAGGTSYAGILHDETKGKSGLYSCTPSYDLVTGLGSPQVGALIDALTK